jgi:hypothetical protein
MGPLSDGKAEEGDWEGGGRNHWTCEPGAVYICVGESTGVDDDAQYPKKRMQSETSKLSGICMATFLVSFNHYFGSIVDGAAKMLVLGYAV